MGILWATLFLAALAAVLSIVLVVAARRFAVKENPLAAAIDQALPQYNCGACGFPGCSGFARHLAENRDPNAVCIPGGPALAEKLAALLGIEVAGGGVPQVAHVLCRGSHSQAASRGRYIGLADCVAADLVGGATKVCPVGCLGLGSCVRACSFNAISQKEGLAVVDESLCVACRKCVDACPRALIRMVPKGDKVVVACRTTDRGAPVKKYCTVGCITCQLCVKKCPEQAIALVDGRITIDHGKCVQCGICVDLCPQHSIVEIGPRRPRAAAGEESAS